MSKKLLSIFMVTVLLLLSSVNTFAAQTDGITLSLQQATDKVVANGKSLQLLNEKVKLAQSRYSYAVLLAKDAPEKYWGSDSQHIENKKAETLYPMQREAELKDLKWQRQNSENSLRVNVTNQYFQILQKQMSVENQQNIISFAQNEFNIRKKQADAGTLTETALANYEIAVDEAKTTLKSIQAELDKMYIDFNDLLGLPLDTKVSLEKTDLPSTVLDVASIDRLAADIVTASYEVKKLQSDKLLKKTEYDILCQYSFFRPAECNTLEDDMLNLDYNIKDKKAEIELKVYTDYNNLLNLKDDITIKKLEYDLKVKLLDIAKKKVDLGISTGIDWQKAQGDRDTALYNYNQAQLSYCLAVVSFKNYIAPIEIK